MKNIIAAALAVLVLAVTVAGCGSSSNTNSSGHPNCDATITAIENCCNKPPASIAAECPTIIAAAQNAEKALQMTAGGGDCGPNTFVCPAM